MKITELALPGVKIIEPTYFEDYRGYYCETYSRRTLAEYGIITFSLWSEVRFGEYIFRMRHMPKASCYAVFGVVCWILR